jgi:hypothetical protein
MSEFFSNYTGYLQKSEKTTGASMFKRVFAAIGGLGLVALIALIYHLKSSPMSQGPMVSVQRDRESVDPTENEESTGDAVTSLGSLLGCNKPAPPPIVFYVGPPPDAADTPDLSTPAVAVHSVLSLIDQGATDKLAPCFIAGTEDTVSKLYPRYLGHPIELVEVIEEGQCAEVVWKATVHTEFSMDGTNRAPGETITLKTKLIRVEDIWKLLKLHDGGKDGIQ